MDPEKNSAVKEANVQYGYRSSDIADDDMVGVTKPEGTLNRDLQNRHMQSTLISGQTSPALRGRPHVCVEVHLLTKHPSDCNWYGTINLFQVSQGQF